MSRGYVYMHSCFLIATVDRSLIEIIIPKIHLVAMQLLDITICLDKFVLS